jgi:hypothetical protein
MACPRICAALCAATLATSATAAEPAGQARRADALRAEGEALFVAGEWRAALARFQQAWDGAGAPADLVRLGRCQYKLGELAAAKDHLFHYLQLEPIGAHAPEAFALIREIESLETETRAPARAAPAPWGLARKLALGTAGVAAALGGVGAVFGLQARHTNSVIFRQPHDRTELQSLQGELWRESGRANSFFIAAAGALGVATTLWVLDF